MGMSPRPTEMRFCKGERDIALESVFLPQRGNWTGGVSSCPVLFFLAHVHG